MEKVTDILKGKSLSKEDIIMLLHADAIEQKELFSHALKVKQESLGQQVYFRGLIEFSNICAKDCLYCGIRAGNSNVYRYNLTDEEIINAAEFAYRQNYSSIVLQSGELTNLSFIRRINFLLQKIHQRTNNSLRITLSLGEQSSDTYKTWFESGAHRYLLRMETSNPELYQKIHPDNDNHSFNKRLDALKKLKDIGYQTGTGVMIGLPYQTTEDLADDLLFMKDFGIDMVGMGPYIEHKNTPMFEMCEQLLSRNDRFILTLKMIALLRILMPEINIAAATALQAINKMGREKAIKVGANVLMPNITPGKYRDYYKLYNDKPCTGENADDCTNCLETRVSMTGSTVAYGEWGDSRHYTIRNC